LAEDWGVDSRLYSATSYTELARDARATERWNRLNPLEEQRKSHVETLLEGDTPVIATTDYVRALPQLISAYIDARLVALGTDGFGRSDTRATLRDFFEVDRFHIVIAALSALSRDGLISGETCAAALEKYSINAKTEPPWEC
jgi:pyruvate dehydrogenase E1 component